MVGLLAAVGTAMSALVAFAQSDLVWLIILGAATATGLAAYAVAPLQKKSSDGTRISSIPGTSCGVAIQQM